ncbi:MAG: hypothetical protein ACPGJS_20090, partial [Flammeovirgaceae bacterium]
LLRVTYRVYDEEIIEFLRRREGTNNEIISRTLMQHPSLVMEINKLRNELADAKKKLHQASSIIKRQVELQKLQQEFVDNL